MKSNHFFSSPDLPNCLYQDNGSPIFNSCYLHLSSKQFVCTYNKCLNQSDCFKDSFGSKTEEFRTIQYHSDDRDLWCKRVFPDILKFFKSNNINSSADHRISFNHRYLMPDGKISQFLHEGKLEIGKQNESPLLKLFVFTDLGQIKTDDSMSLTISLYFERFGFHNVFNKIYITDKHIKLSPRELEILHLCKEGHSGKMIAEKLNLSLHTVKNHKRNIMTKTTTHNITELIHYCNKYRWL